MNPDFSISRGASVGVLKGPTKPKVLQNIRDKAIAVAAESGVFQASPHVKCARNYITIRRRRMTPETAERLRRAARKMVKDFRKFIKRKGLK